MTDTTEILKERGKRYGRFDGHANVTQRLKGVIAGELHIRRKELANDQQEALDMICHKIGRIINGDANYEDSWRDIAGYAQLVADRLLETGKPALPESVSNAATDSLAKAVRMMGSGWKLVESANSIIAKDSLGLVHIWNGEKWILIPQY